MFIPFLEQNTELTPEDEKRLGEIMATEEDWFHRGKEPAEEEITPEQKPHYTVEQTSDAFADPFIIRNNQAPEDSADRYYDVGGIYQTFETEEEAQEYADTLNHVEREGQQKSEPAPSGTDKKQDNSDLIGKELMIDNRRYLIESVGKISGDVSMRDITFQNNVGFPINRVEKVGYVRRILEQEKEQSQQQRQIQKEPQPEEKSESPAEPTTETVAEYPAVENGLPYDIVMEKIRFGEPEHEQPRKTPVTAKPSAPALSADRRNYRITDDALGVGGAKEKFRNNMSAIKLLHDLQIENRPATPKEQETLAKYVGLGAVCQWRLTATMRLGR